PGTRFGVNLEVIKAIEVVDPYTVQITLKAFDPVFPLRMAGYQQGYIMSKKAVEKHGEQFKWNPIGTGPFYFDRHSPREKVVLKAFDQFRGGRPQIDDIRVRRAFMHAIDRKAIKETMYPGRLGRLAVSPVPAGYFGHVPVELPEYNPDLAKKLLAEAGYPNGFTVKNYFVSKSFFFPKVATLAQ